MKKKFTLLPKKLDHALEEIPDKRMQLITKWMLFFLFISILFLFKPVYAGLGAIFGYPDGTNNLYEYVLSGKSIHKTMGVYFNTQMFNEINHMDIIQNILNITSGIGLILVLYYTIHSILQAGQRGELTKNYIWRLAIVFILPMYLIINMNIITDGVRYVGSYIKDSIIMETYDISLNEAKSAVANGSSLEELAAGNVGHADELYEHVKDVLGYNVETEEERKVLVEHHKIGGKNILIYDNGDYEIYLGPANDDGWKMVSYDADYSWFNDVLRDAINVVLQLIMIGIDIGICVGIMVACYGVMGRLLIYQSFLPISIADIGEKGLRSNGVRMIKQYLALYMEVGMFYLILYIGLEVYYILAMQQESIAGLIICLLTAGIGIRTVMRGARGITERLLNI